MEMETTQIGAASYGDKVGLIHDPPDKKSESMDSDGTRAESSPLHKSGIGPPPSGKKNLSQSHSLRIIIVSGIVFSIAVTISLILTLCLSPPQIGAHAGVASDVPLCSELGLSIIMKGGNAVDSAVTTILCLGVVNPHTSGIGGGGFMIVHNHKEHTSVGYDFLVTAPKAAKNDMFPTAQSRLVGGKSIAVPGELRGLEMAHKEFGKLSWRDVVIPAAEIAKNGFNITKAMANVLRKKFTVETFPMKLKNLYVRNGHFVAEGDLVINAELAATLTSVAERGADAFYKGSIARSIIKTVERNGGVLSLKDLENYRVVKRRVVSTYFKGTAVTTMPAPSSGPILLLMLNMIEGFNLTTRSRNDHYTYHRLIETFKFAYANQWLIADPEYIITVANDTSKLISKKFADELRAKIDNSTHSDEYYGSMYEPSKDKGTTHLSIIDASELMVSVTSSINYLFGSQIMTDTGIVLNDCIDDFSFPGSPNVYGLQPNPNNFLNTLGEPKRPMSSMVPVIVHNVQAPCRLRFALGAANGSRIITGVVETIVNMMVFEMGLAAAIESPRLHNQHVPNNTEYEAEFSPLIIRDLRAMGHDMTKVSQGLSVVQGVAKTNDNLEAHSDTRKFGKSAEFRRK